MNKALCGRHIHNFIGLPYKLIKEIRFNHNFGKKRKKIDQIYKSYCLLYYLEVKAF